MKGALGKSLLVLAGTLLCLFVLEASLRLTAGVSLSEDVNFTARRMSLTNVHPVNRHDPLLGWGYRENLRIEKEKVRFTTGPRGIRLNGPGAEPLPSGAILAAGDSFTVGEEVSDDATWPAHLERMLREPVINAAVGGWGADQIILRAESLIPICRPRLVIVSFLEEDIERAEYRVFAGANKPYFLVEDTRLIHRNAPVPVFTGNAAEIGTLRSLLGRSILVTRLMVRLGDNSWWDDMHTYRRAGTDGVRVSTLLLQRLKTHTDEEGIGLLFLLQYGGEVVIDRRTPPEEAIRVKEGALRSGIEVVDTWNPLHQLLADGGPAALKSLYILHGEAEVFGHMSSRGNRFVARLLADRIRGGSPP